MTRLSFASSGFTTDSKLKTLEPYTALSLVVTLARYLIVILWDALDWDCFAIIDSRTLNGSIAAHGE